MAVPFKCSNWNFYLLCSNLEYSTCATPDINTLFANSSINWMKGNGLCGWDACSMLLCFLFGEANCSFLLFCLGPLSNDVVSSSLLFAPIHVTMSICILCGKSNLTRSSAEGRLSISLIFSVLKMSTLLAMESLRLLKWWPKQVPITQSSTLKWTDMSSSKSVILVGSVTMAWYSCNISTIKLWPSIVRQSELIRSSTSLKSFKSSWRLLPSVNMACNFIWVSLEGGCSFLCLPFASFRPSSPRCSVGGVSSKREMIAHLPVNVKHKIILHFPLYIDSQCPECWIETCEKGSK